MPHDVSESEWSPQGPVTELSDDESWALLGNSAFGHLGLSVEDRPEIFPVNYAIDGRTLLFRTAAGTKLNELVDNRFVAFEVDSEGPVGTWSVVLKGTASVLKDAGEIALADLEKFPPWIPTLPYVYVRILPIMIRGRQFEHHLRVERAQVVRDASDADEVLDLASTLSEQTGIPAKTIEAKILDHMLSLNGIVDWNHEREWASGDQT